MRKQLGILASLIFLSATALLWTGCSSRCNTENSCYTEPVCQEPSRPVCPEPCETEFAEPTRSICPPEPCRPVCPPQRRPEPCRPICAPEPRGPVCAPVPCRPPCPPEPCRPACAPAPCRPVCAPEPCRPVCAPEPCRQQAPEYCPPKCAAPLKPCKYGTSGECACNGIIVKARNPKMCMLGDQYPLEFDVIACCDVCESTVTTTLPEGVTYMRSQPEAKVDGRSLTWDFGSLSKGQTIPAKVWL